MAAETIVALSTPPGPSALALLRMSGPQAHAIAREHVRNSIAPGRSFYSPFRSSGEVIDDVVVTCWAAPASYTGEDLIEISCHGNMLIAEKILQALLLSGARPAGPGEFTQRAFLNGKMDLTQAEAVMDLIQARSDRALRAARALQEGRLGQKLSTQRENLLQILSHLEAYIDFPDEDISPEVGAEMLRQMEAVRTAFQQLLDSGREGRLLRSGLTVVLAGPPNAGKSSLLNALLERDRAIVSPVAGTTRDTIEEEIFLEGICVRLVDSAGWWESPDEVEKLGLERTRRALERADLILQLVDGSEAGTAPTDLPLPPGVPVLVCRTKADLPEKNPREGLALSALTGQGLPELKLKIVQLMKLRETSTSLDAVAVNLRHETLLREAASGMERALVRAREQAPPELTSADLRQTLAAIGNLVGQVSNEDILDRLFKNFCIGK